MHDASRRPSSRVTHWRARARMRRSTPSSRSTKAARWPRPSAPSHISRARRLRRSPAFHSRTRTSSARTDCARPAPRACSKNSCRPTTRPSSSGLARRMPCRSARRTWTSSRWVRRTRTVVLRPGAQPVGRDARARRLVGRFGRRGGRRHRAVRDRHRHRRLDSPAGGVLRHHRTEADLRPRLALGHDRVRFEPGLRRRARAQRARIARAYSPRSPATIRAMRRASHAVSTTTSPRCPGSAARRAHRRRARVFRRRRRSWASARPCRPRCVI